MLICDVFTLCIYLCRSVPNKLIHDFIAYAKVCEETFRSSAFYPSAECGQREGGGGTLNCAACSIGENYSYDMDISFE